MDPKAIKRACGEFDLEVITRLAMPRRGIQRIENLEGSALLRQLDLSHNEIGFPGGLQACVELRQADLSHNRIARLAGAGLEALAELETLQLQGNQITDVDEVAALAALPKLRSLSLRNADGSAANPCCAHPAYFQVVTRHLPGLLTLDGEALAIRESAQAAILRESKVDDAALALPPRRRWCDEMDWGLDDSAPVVSAEDIDGMARGFTEAIGGCRALDAEAGELHKRLHQLRTAVMGGS